MELQIITGNIVNMWVDVIVNSTSTDLDHTTGSLAESIVNTGGYSIVSQISAEYPDGISHDDIAVTEGGDLSCDEIYHLALPEWSDNEQFLREMIEKCLSKADEEHSTIAFPALGTETLDYPPDVVATSFLIDNFASKGPNNLTGASIVLWPENTEVINAFQDAVNNFQPSDDLDLSVDIDDELETLSVQLVVGDITKQQTDVIVNSTIPSLDLSSGPLTKAVLKAGGKILQDQCKRDYPKGIEEDEIAVTSGGKLSCQRVYHTTSCQWGEDAEKKLCSLIMQCMREADEDDRASISFPALGTGVLKYPPQTVAKCFLETTSCFFGDSLKQIFIVVREEDNAVVEAFQQEIKRHNAGETDDTFRVSVIQGDITQQNVDVIVNSTTPGLDLSSGPVSQAILATGGSSLQDECKTKYPNGIKVGEIAETSGGNMPCQSVYHTALPRTEDGSEVEEVLCNLIDRCLTTAASEGRSSIAFPVLGTGSLNYPREKVAQCLYSSFDQFSSDNSGTSLSEVRLVIHPGDAENLRVFAAGDQAEAPLFLSTREVTEIFNQETEAESSTPTAAPASTVELQPVPNAGCFSQLHLPPSHKEYKKIAQKFAQGTNNQFTIIKIDRIENKALHDQYQIKKQEMVSKNPGMEVERHLWHGTRHDVIPCINNNGFDRSYKGENATLYGDGTYFAVKADYSAQPLYSPSDSCGHRRMYYAAVLTGRFTLGESGMKFTPPRDKAKPHIKYDSVVDDTDNPSMFVVFNDTQAYPKYLVTFQ